MHPTSTSSPRIAPIFLRPVSTFPSSVVMVTNVLSDFTFDVIEPALIAIPTWSDAEKEMFYEVTMEPKHTPRPDQPNHTAPQTGLQDRTLYYLAGAGGCIAVAGVLLLIGRKRKR